MASVCTTFRTAAHMLLRRWPGLDLDHGTTRPVGRLDSRLLLEWGPTCFQRLWLGHDSLEVPGMFAFLPACEQLVELEVHCLDVLACQRMNACLGGLSRLAILRCKGWLVPTSLPRCLNELVVDLSRWSAASLGTHGLKGAAEALLFTLADAPDLESLSLDLGALPRLPATSGVVMQQLNHISINFRFDTDTTIDLGWLQAQGAQDVFLTIAFDTGNEAEQARLVKLLQAFTIHRLRLALSTGIDGTAQRQWAKLLIQQCVEISVHQSQMLVAAPQCACLHFSLFAPGETPLVVTLEWALESSCIGHVCLQAWSIGRFHLLGFTGHAPNRAQPWQLWTDWPAHDLMDAFAASRGGWRLQNHAADAAGWS